MCSKISHDTAQQNIARVALMGSIPEGLIHTISGLQSCFSNDWFFFLQYKKSQFYKLLSYTKNGQEAHTENNSKQTLCYVRHTAHFKHFGPKVHWLFLMIILVHKG